ncbi:MAG: hypothetical protein AAFX54_15140 [Pseudomonadota bacterium]
MSVSKDESDDLKTSWRAQKQKRQAALESAGVEFIPENGGGPGVRLRKS